MSSNPKIGSKRKLPPEEGDSLLQTWINLRKGIDEIYARHVMPVKPYMDLYGLVYKYCTTTYPPPKCPHLDGTDDVSPKNTLLGEELYNLLADFIDTYLTKVEKEGDGLVGEDVLKFYIKQWDDYRFSSKVLNGICSYLNRHWMKRKVAEFGLNVASVYQMALISWKNYTKTSFHPRIKNAILKMINDERNGETINSTLISSVTSSYVELSFYVNINNITNEGDLDLYKELIESVFLEETEQFYIRESNEFLNQNSVSEYVKKVELRFLEEEKRVKIYLHESTLQPLLKICEKVLIEMHLESLKASFRTLMMEDKAEDLNHVFRLIRKIPNSLNEFYEVFQSHVHEEGIVAIERCGETVSNDPKMYIETILRVRNLFFGVVSRALENSPGFLEAFDKGCAKFINKNFVTQMKNSSSTKSSELVARYCDLLLKKSTKYSEGNEIEDILNQIIYVFKYIEDKDVFQKYYSKLLAKRLVFQSSANNDAEASMIGKLKLACGNDYTSRLQRMFNDITISNDLNDKFRNLTLNADDPLELDFGIHVLSSGTWPFPQSCNFSLPSELEKSVQRFITFYNCQHNGRKLQWHYQLSKGELITNCFQNRYTLQVSTFQIAVLLQFNTDDSFTVQQLQENTQIQMEYLTQVLQILLKAKLLVCDPKEDELQESSVVKVFKGYKNKRQRVNLNVPMKVEVKVERDATVLLIEEERKILVQAAIVRIMKARRELKHQQLLSEVFEQLSTQFKPTVVFIKKNIDVLIEKEYLDRSKTESDTYIYLA